VVFDSFISIYKKWEFLLINPSLVLSSSSILATPQVVGEEVTAVARHEPPPAPPPPIRDLNFAADAAKAQKEKEVIPATGNSSKILRQNGILIRKVGGASIQDVLRAISTVVSPSQILYCDHAGPNNYGVWVKSEESVCALAEKDSVVVKGQLAKINLYTNPVRRVVMSNVPPFLPDQIITNYLKKIR